MEQQDLTETITDSEAVEASPESSDKHDHIVGGEDLVVLDDASEPGREEAHDLENQVSHTSEDVLGGMAGEGAELHPEFDDFYDDQHFEVLDTADGDFSGESHDLEEQSPDTTDDKKDRGGREKDSLKKDKVSPEKSGTVHVCS